MIQAIRKSRLGFTLIELAIVLAIAGLLFAGLWRLLSGGNQQLRDQSAASSHAQLISSAKSYLNSSEGSQFMQAMAANGTILLPLPATLANAAGTAACSTTAPMSAPVNPGAPGLCSFLPPGFWSGTTNSYGQTYAIRVLKDGAAAGTAPSTYSFMILTSGGDVIPDTSGGRVTSLIGGDGGFVYSSDVCTAGGTFKTTSCGAYGAWAATLAAYGFGVPATGGYIASRTYYAPEQSSNYPWLARSVMPGDTTLYTYNSMTTPLYMKGNALDLGTYGAVLPTNGGGAISMQGGNINMVTPATTVGGGNFNLSGGAINMQAGQVFGQDDASNINLTHPNVQATIPLLTLSTKCSLLTTVGCPAAINITAGDVSLPNGQLNANTIYAQTFVYQGASDIRLKTDIRPLMTPLADLMKIRPVFFTYKASGQQSIGVIAQELEKVYPQLISQNQGTKYVSYDGLIAPLIGAVQELKHENDDLRQLLKEQTAREDKLEKKLTQP